MARTWIAVGLGGFLAGAALTGTTVSAAQKPRASAVTPRVDVRAVMDRYCVGCHNQKAKIGGLALDGLDPAAAAGQAETWEKVVRKLRGGVMPPAGAPRPDPATYEALRASLERTLDGAAAAAPNAGRTEAFHRLNRTEYRNAVRDLLDIEIDVAALLPADDASYGFDNMAGVLKLSESLVERYLAAARKVSRIAVGSAPPAPTNDVFGLPSDLPQYDRVEGLPFGTRGGTVIKYYAQQDAEYNIKVDLMCVTEADLKCNGAIGFAEAHDLMILVDGEPVHEFNLAPRKLNISTPQDPQGLEIRVPVKAGPHQIGVTFRKTIPDREMVRGAYRQRFERPYRYYADIQAIGMPFVETVSIIGPLGAMAPGDTPSRRRIFSCQPTTGAGEAGCAKTILASLARRAYRRPVGAEDVATLMAFYQEGAAGEGSTFDTGIENALRALLVSPEFLFRVERDPAGAKAGTNYRISDLELASRLSFFLWSSIPDEQLLKTAERGQLRNPAVLEREVRRMLADERSSELVNNFAGQWLKLRNLFQVRPSEALYPDFDDTLRQAFRRETELFFDYIVHSDRSVMEFLTADYSFLNERLAKHYGVPNVKGVGFRRVVFSADNPRRGLLGQGSVLSVNSRPTRTSPVLRGKWILETILGTPPPPPPPNVPQLKENEGQAVAQSMRERMAQHRANPVCSACHSMIDPAGFALENFDTTGRWRAVDESFKPVDPSGVLPDGTKFGTLQDFQQSLAGRPERFVTVVAERLLTYALGRGVEYYDQPVVRKIVHGSATSDYRFSSIVLGIVNSMPFQMRRAES